MAQSAGANVITNMRETKTASFGIKYSTFIIVALVLMFAALVYVGSHIRMTEMEYNIAAALSAKEKMLEEQKKLKLELAMLKSPQRIENIARKQLMMSYPEAQQVVVLKKTGE